MLQKCLRLPSARTLYFFSNQQFYYENFSDFSALKYLPDSGGCWKLNDQSDERIKQWRGTEQ